MCKYSAFKRAVNSTLLSKWVPVGYSKYKV